MEKFTDQYFTYRETPVDYDGVGNITRIKGNTLVWNQIVNLSFDVNLIKGSSRTVTKGFTSGVSIVASHKYLLKWKLTNVVNSTSLPNFCAVGIYTNESGANKTISQVFESANGSYSQIFTSSYSGTSNGTIAQTNGNIWLYFIINSSGADSDTATFSDVQLFDLTKMYGSGNEPTADEFVSLFSNSYYPYDSGSLLSFMGSGIKTANADESKESTTDLPVLTYFPTGMKSAGTVYDELTPAKSVKRIGVADLGTFTWTMYSVSQGNLFRSPNLNAIGYALQYDSTNLLCAKYPTVKSSSRTDKSISVGSNNCVDIVDSSYSDANAFKNAMNGVYLHYELATESEQDINTKMLYPTYADGTEQILPTSDTSPFFGDIEYYNGTEGETNIRKFWLINGENERWDLTEKEFKAFLNNPQGLGFRKTVESVRYGERQNKVSETYNFPQPQGELLFYDSYNSTRYDKYNKFIRFLMNQPITLFYMIPVSYISGIANIYTLDCEVTEVQKTESKTDNILRSSIVFNGMEFYKGDPITVNGTGTSYTLTNDGDFPVGFEITVEGNLTNPYVTLEQDGELYGEAKFDSSTAFSSVYVNSNDGEQNVILEQGGSIIPNPLSYQDLSISNGSIYVTFVKLARGVSELSIGAESGTVSSVKIEFTPMYRSV